MLRNYTLYLGLFLGFFLCHSISYGYIGPGAGFAFLGSAFVLISAVFMAIITILFWPIRWLYKSIRGKKMSPHALAKRVIIVGLDGFDPELTDQYLAEGKLPHFEKLKSTGSYHRLKTTFPPISPVAWSTFQTGVNPGSHNIFDFLTRDKRYHLPDLSSARIGSVKKFLKIGKWNLPLEKPEVKLLRKSKPFWKILGQQGIFSHIIRVPISFPPEDFHGNVLSAMCTPDLKGTQGSFSFFTSNEASLEDTTGGTHHSITIKNHISEFFIEGPINPYRRDKMPIRIPCKIEIHQDSNSATLHLQKKKYDLKVDQLSDWIRLEFKAFFKVKISGIVKFCLRQTDPHLSLYMSPINIDPENPALPISKPSIYSIYLSKLNGPYGTLGLLEDTWARNEKALNNETFLQQAYQNHEERQKMFFDALDKTNTGVCVCVFDASDRIQHMFWRYLDASHPAPKEEFEKFHQVIPDMYQKMDNLIGKVQEKLNKGDILIVLSDHGFKSFRRCVHLNTWLLENGYLTLKPDASGKDHFLDVDWSQTQAFAVGLSGLFINKKGRERYGIVSDKDFNTLKNEIKSRLLMLKDPENNESVINSIEDTHTLYKGAYKYDAPDLVIGYKPGYRISWDSVTGKIKDTIFEDNAKAWSGDHSIDPEYVPGVLFTNQSINPENPHIVDMAPTVLKIFDIKAPKYMEGKSLI